MRCSLTSLTAGHLATRLARAQPQVRVVRHHTTSVTFHVSLRRSRVSILPPIFSFDARSCARINLVSFRFAGRVGARLGELQLTLPAARGSVLPFLGKKELKTVTCNRSHVILTATSHPDRPEDRKNQHLRITSTRAQKHTIESATVTEDTGASISSHMLAIRRYQHHESAKFSGGAGGRGLGGQQIVHMS